ncbi:hypothetical protein ACFLZZ_00925 [Nanoarchaeota archaeon]
MPNNFDLEKRVKRFFARTISEDGKINWKAVERLTKREKPIRYREKAYDLFIKYLVKKKILSYEKEENYGLFILHDVDFHPIRSEKGSLYFIKEEDADHYKQLIDKNAIRVAKVK